MPSRASREPTTANTPDLTLPITLRAEDGRLTHRLDLLRGLVPSDARVQQQASAGARAPDCSGARWALVAMRRRTKRRGRRRQRAGATCSSGSGRRLSIARYRGGDRFDEFIKDALVAIRRTTHFDANNRYPPTSRCPRLRFLQPDNNFSLLAIPVYVNGAGRAFEMPGSMAK